MATEKGGDGDWTRGGGDENTPSVKSEEGEERPSLQAENLDHP